MRAPTAPSPELRREITTMVLYMSVVLMATIAAVPAEEWTSRFELIGIVWGGALGLALAHWFAFRASVRLYAGNRLRSGEALEGAAEALAALSVAAVATVPLVVADEQRAAAAAIVTLTGVITVVGYTASRRAGLPPRRAAGRAMVTMAAGVVVAIAKALLGH